MARFLVEYSLHPFSYGQRIIINVPPPANKYIALYIRSATFKLDSFSFLKDSHKIGTLGAYVEAEIDPSTNIGLNLLEPEIFEETDHIFSQLGTGSDSKFSCIVIKLSQKADFSQIQMVILP